MRNEGTVQTSGGHLDVIRYGNGQHVHTRRLHIPEIGIAHNEAAGGRGKNPRKNQPKIHVAHPPTSLPSAFFSHQSPAPSKHRWQQRRKQGCVCH